MEGWRRFEFVGGGSSKFWEITYHRAEVTIHFGRIGTNGQTQTKDLGNETAAAFHAAKLIEEKLAKGYVAVKPTGNARAAGSEGSLNMSGGISRPPVLPPYEVPPLPEDGRTDIGGIRLPAGHRRMGNPSMAPPGIEMVTAPVLWLSDAPLAEPGRQLFELRGPAAVRGLVPLLFASLEADDQRPWDSQEFAPTDPRRIDHVEAEQVLADMWHGCFEESDGVALVPFGVFFAEAGADDD